MLLRRVLVIVCSIICGISAAIVEGLITGPPEERFSIMDPWFWLFIVPCLCLFIFSIFWIGGYWSRSHKKIQDKLTIKYQELKNHTHLSQEIIYDILRKKMRKSEKDLYRIETDGIGKVYILPRNIHIT